MKVIPWSDSRDRWPKHVWVAQSNGYMWSYLDDYFVYAVTKEEPEYYSVHAQHCNQGLDVVYTRGYEASTLDQALQAAIDLTITAIHEFSEEVLS